MGGGVGAGVTAVVGLAGFWASEPGDAVKRAVAHVPGASPSKPRGWGKELAASPAGVRKRRSSSLTLVSLVASPLATLRGRALGPRDLQTGPWVGRDSRCRHTNCCRPSLRLWGVGSPPPLRPGEPVQG